VSEPAFTLTVPELEALIRKCIREEHVERDSVSYLTLAEAAKLLKLSTKTLLKRIKDKALPAERVGREWRFEKSKLVAAMRGEG
jgi:excisionase family DNA binding protein